MKFKVTSFKDKTTGMPYLVYSNRKLKEEGKIIGISAYEYQGSMYPFIVAGNGIGMAVIDDIKDETHLTIYNKV
jgi:hypothetical protein